MHVAVVGAGMAGLSCAAALAEAGCRVDVFEKSRGPGGRMATRRDHGTAFDIGAQYFTARDPAFSAAVRRWQDAGAVARWPVVPWQIDARGALTPSPDDTPRWVGTPRMSALVQQLPGRNIALCTQVQVGAVTRRDGRWFLQAGDALAPGGFDAVVLALPAAQVVPLAAAAPAVAAAAAAAVMEPCWAVVLGFASASGIAIDAAFARDQPVNWLARNSSKPGRAALPETWVLHAATAWTEEHLEAPAESVAKHLRDWFGDLLSPQVQPAWLHAHRWRYARTTDTQPGHCLLDAGQRLGACGDWCGGGRVEGAWLSGRALAARLLDATA